MDARKSIRLASGQGGSIVDFVWSQRRNFLVVDSYRGGGDDCQVKTRDNIVVDSGIVEDEKKATSRHVIMHAIGFREITRINLLKTKLDCIFQALNFNLIQPTAGDCGMLAAALRSTQTL